MPLTDEQLKTIIARSLPGARLRQAHALGARTTLLALDDRRQVVLRISGAPDEWAGEPVAAEAAALAELRAEIDLPLPELIAYEPDGRSPGAPYLLYSYIDGVPLPDVLGELPEAQRHAIGRQLGAIVARVHGHAAGGYGALAGEDEPSGQVTFEGSDDVAYLAERLAHAIAVARVAGELDAAGGERLLAWLRAHVTTTNQPACLCHGDLLPERVLVRRRERSWRVAGLLGWGYAQGWRPAWDHATLIESCADHAYFPLRVGYGTAYDETTERRYDQLRDFALLPYRLVLYLEAGRADLALALLGDERGA